MRAASDSLETMKSIPSYHSFLLTHGRGHATIIHTLPENSDCLEAARDANSPEYKRFLKGDLHITDLIKGFHAGVINWN